MRKWQQMVQAFHEKAGAVVNHKPTQPDANTQILRLTLIDEETIELDDALGIGDLVEIADALGDLLYVVLGTAVTCGIDIEPIFEEIHRSNMSKFIDGYRREDGKWIKGPSYSPANLEPILKNQASI